MTKSKKRRTAGEGSVFQDERGYWNVQIPLGHVRGRLTYKRIRCKTLAGLHEKRRAFEEKRARGMITTTKTPTVQEFLLQWLEQSVKTRNRYRTEKSYRQITMDHLIPHLGRHRLDTLERSHVQTMINSVQAAGRAPRTIRNIRAVLRRALTVAMSDGHVLRNVAKLVDLPKAEKPKIRTLSPEESRRLLAAVQNHRLKALYWMALLLGLRQGELCGLRWEDVDLDRAIIRLVQAVQRQNGKLVFTPLKTESSQEVLPIPAPLIAILREHRVWQDEERCDSKWREHGLVFPSERGTPLEPRGVARHFKAMLEDANLPDIPFHNLRHTCGTTIADMGVHAKMIQAILRHASHHTTLMYYIHSQDEKERAAVEGLGALLAGPESALEGLRTEE